jgi:hypothetical protein
VQIYAGLYEQANRQLATVSNFVGNEDAKGQTAWLLHLQGLLALRETSYSEAHSAFARSTRIWHSTYPHHFIPPLAALGLASYRLSQLALASQHLSRVIADASAHKSATPALAALPPIALALATTGKPARAIEIWTLARRHPFVANSRWFADVAGRHLDEIAASLPASTSDAARARGRTLDVWDTSRELLTELEELNL